MMYDVSNWIFQGPSVIDEVVGEGAAELAAEDTNS
jgi:hypothetical protein